MRVNHGSGGLRANRLPRMALRRIESWYLNVLRRFEFLGLRDLIIALETRALLQSQHWSSEEIGALQLDRMRSVVARALRIPFWRERLLAAGISSAAMLGWEDFYRIPIIRKSDLKNTPVGSYTDARLMAQKHFEGTTSGSTGTPLVFFHDRDYEIHSIAACRRMFLVASRGKTSEVIYIRRSYRHGFTKNTKGWFCVYSYNQIRHQFDAFREMTTKMGHRGYVLYSFSSYLMEIARLCEERKVTLSPVAVIYSGEALRPEEVTYIQDRLGAPAFNSYGACELGWMTFGCEYDHLHVNAEFVLVEILDERGKAVKSGEPGRVIVTHLHNKIMPFIRYDTGDIGTLPADPCACGRGLPVLRLLGRQTDFIVLPNDRKVPAIDILGIFLGKKEHIRQYQVIQKEQKKLLVRIVPEVPASEETLSGLREILQRELHPDMEILFEIVDELPAAPSGKMISFVPLQLPQKT